MVIGLASLMTSMTLGLLLFLAAREHHRTGDDTDTFRYPRLLVNTLAFLIPVYVGCAAFIYSQDPKVPKPPAELLALAGIFGTFVIGNTLAYFYFRAFAVQITDTGILVTTWKGTKSVHFADVRVLLITNGRPGIADMTLLDGQDRRLLKVGSSIQDFDDLVVLIKENTPDAIVREKDRSGR